MWAKIWWKTGTDKWSMELIAISLGQIFEEM
jgi:hypothetical protein